MFFKGKRVHVEVDDQGELVLDNGRAVMRYKPDDERVYNPWPANLSDRPGAKAIAQKSQGARKPSPPPPPVDDPDAVIAYTDGACLGNPGPAGLGYAISFPDGREVSAGEPLGEGTNNIAELTAILRVLELVDNPDARLLIHTDSSYSIGVLTQGWKAKANKELIARIRGAMSSFSKIELIKVKGHSGVELNELVDDLARRAAEEQQRIDWPE